MMVIVYEIFSNGVLIPTSKKTQKVIMNENHINRFIIGDK